MDADRFRAAAVAVLSGEGGGVPGIGTLGEKALHAVVKRYLEPDPARWEVKCGPYVADILNGDGVTEIQTRQFGRLRGKLHYYLEQRKLPVTVVFPIAGRKRLVKMESATGRVLSRRRSPKAGRMQDVFPELYCLRPMLTNPLLRVRLLLLEEDEIRLEDDGLKPGRRRGVWAGRVVRLNHYPRALLGELTVGGHDGYGALLPDELRFNELRFNELRFNELRFGGPQSDGPDPGGTESGGEGERPVFTSADYARACGIPLSVARTGLSLMTGTGDVRRVGKRGNAFLYTAARKTP